MCRYSSLPASEVVYGCHGQRFDATASSECKHSIFAERDVDLAIVASDKGNETGRYDGVSNQSIERAYDAFNRDGTLFVCFRIVVGYRAEVISRTENQRPFFSADALQFDIVDFGNDRSESIHQIVSRHSITYVVYDKSVGVFAFGGSGFVAVGVVVFFEDIHSTDVHTGFLQVVGDCHQHGVINFRYQSDELKQVDKLAVATAFYRDLSHPLSVHQTNSNVDYVLNFFLLRGDSGFSAQNEPGIHVLAAFGCPTDRDVFGHAPQNILRFVVDEEG